ncbi:MAG: 4-hydroxy-3-methylbut-2-enyl diphosphate reductase [Gemmatimonadota bacterium]|nr:MAG: 4-hydroxy-3-methylbut-2-enyl diphosphate reductase [Gemmatimonadota bacterium]
MGQTYFRKGFGLKRAIAGSLAGDYHSQLIDKIRSSGNTLAVDDLTIKLAKEFGFCYGVDRAVEYAYETESKFPDKRVFLVGEIIHNPHVNAKLESMSITILRPDSNGRFDYSAVTADDVVIIPAFGVTLRDFQYLRELGCILVDTTCGSVLNVWKRVEQYARDGFTAMVHGKYFHEETKATASQVEKFANGKYLIVRDTDECEAVCRFIEEGGEAGVLDVQFRGKVSEDFAFESDLVRIGIANQTTMLASESLAIADRVAQAMRRRYGEEELAEHFRSFDTICSATQERQDAVLELVEEPLDVMVVIGGYNSSNTNHLAKICSEKRTTYHISDASCIVPDTGSIRFKPVGSDEEVVRYGWLDRSVRTVGISAGASTPNNKIGEAIERILESRGVTVRG